MGLSHLLHPPAHHAAHQSVHIYVHIILHYMGHPPYLYLSFHPPTYTQLPLAAVYIYVYIKGVPQRIRCSPVEVKGAIVRARKGGLYRKECQPSNFNIYQIIILIII